MNANDRTFYCNILRYSKINECFGTLTERNKPYNRNNSIYDANDQIKNLCLNSSFTLRLCLTFFFF